MGELVLIARWLLALVLAVSAVTKLADRSATGTAVVAFGVPERFRRAAPLLPLTELVLTVLLVVPATARWGAIGAAALLVAFSAAVAVNLARGRRPDCNCFGRLSAGPIGGRTLVRNGVLVALAVVATLPRAVRPGDLFARTSAPAILAVAVAVVFAAVLAGLVWLVVELWRQQARLLLRLDALEAATTNASARAALPPAPPVAGPPVGDAAPDPTGTDAEGADRSLSDHWSPGRRTLVVFGDPACRACSDLHPSLAAWLDGRTGRRHVVVVSRTARTPVPDGAALFVDPNRSASLAFGVQGTPSAVLVDGSGTIASPLAEGADAVRSLLASPEANASAPVRFRPRPAQPGQVVAGLELPTSDGAAVLVFWNEHCTHCRGMDDDLRARATRTDGPRVVFVVPSDAQAAAVTDRVPAATALVDAELRTNLALGIPGTPSAAMVDADRRLVRDLAVGPDAVLALLDESPTPHPTALAAVPTR